MYKLEVDPSSRLARLHRTALESLTAIFEGRETENSLADIRNFVKQMAPEGSGFLKLAKRHIAKPLELSELLAQIKTYEELTIWENFIKIALFGTSIKQLKNGNIDICIIGEMLEMLVSIEIDPKYGAHLAQYLCRACIVILESNAAKEDDKHQACQLIIKTITTLKPKKLDQTILEQVSIFAQMGIKYEETDPKIVGLEKIQKIAKTSTYEKKIDELHKLLKSIIEITEQAVEDSSDTWLNSVKEIASKGLESEETKASKKALGDILNTVAPLVQSRVADKTFAFLHVQKALTQATGAQAKEMLESLLYILARAFGHMIPQGKSIPESIGMANNWCQHYRSSWRFLIETLEVFIILDSLCRLGQVDFADGYNSSYLTGSFGKLTSKIEAVYNRFVERLFDTYSFDTSIKPKTPFDQEHFEAVMRSAAT